MNKITLSSDQIQEIEKLANHASTSKQFKIEGQSALFCVLLYAIELGLPPMTCLYGGIRAIQGNIEISPRMMNSMIRKAGHKIIIVKSTNQICELKGVRGDTNEEYVCAFSIEDAQIAGLIRPGSGWQKFPSDMLFARCISRLARRLFPDVISTAYVEGEIEEESAPENAQETFPEIPEYISLEEANEIEEAISKDDPEYRTRLLVFYSKQYGEMKDFTNLPKSALPDLWNAIRRRQSKKEGAN